MQEENIRTPNEVRSSRMKKKLIDTARELFAKNGFAATSTPEIVKLAGVTRGALYHHFNDKKAVFKAVITNEAECVAREIKRTVQSDSGAKQALIDGALAYFEAIAVEGRAKLLLVEGPSVLGHDEIAKIDMVTGGSELKQGLENAVLQGDLRQIPVQEMADLLSAAFDRAALSSLTMPEKKQEYRNAINMLFRALLDWN